MKKNTVLATVHKVFLRPLYSGIAMLVAFVAFSILLGWQNWEIITFIFAQSGTSILAKLHFLVLLYAGITTNFSFLSAALTIIICALFGIQVALLTFYIRRARYRGRTTAINSASIAGLVSGVLGIGCAACGSIIITATLATVGAGGLLLSLPLQGQEFSVVSIGLLFFSIRLLVHKINDPVVCMQ